MDWNPSVLQFTVSNLTHTDGLYYAAFIHTIVFVGIATMLCLLIGYPVAYFLARHSGRYKGLFLVAFFAPFWISYMLRMLAWVSLLQDDGYVNKALEAIGVLDDPVPVAGGQAVHVDPRTRLRVRAVHDLAAVRDPGPDPPFDVGGRPRPGRQPRGDVPTGDASACRNRRSWRAS